MPGSLFGLLKSLTVRPVGFSLAWYWQASCKLAIPVEVLRYGLGIHRWSWKDGRKVRGVASSRKPWVAEAASSRSCAVGDRCCELWRMKSATPLTSKTV